MFWLIPLLFIGSLIAGQLMRPKPKESSRPATLSEFGFPTNDESRPIPVVWGTVKVDGPNILWYGDFENVELTRKVKSGLIGSTQQVFGYRYAFGIDYALCWGVVDAFLEVRSDGKSVQTFPTWNPNSAGAVTTTTTVQRTVIGASNDFPIFITTSLPHTFSTGDIVEISGVEGNYAANGVWSIQVFGSNDFTLVGSEGSGDYTSGGIATKTTSVTTGDLAPIQDLEGTGQEFTVDKRIFYGGDSDDQISKGGEGGIYAVCDFYSGRPTATPNSYLQTLLDNIIDPEFTITRPIAPLPGYRNISHVFFKGPRCVPTNSANKNPIYNIGSDGTVFTKEPFYSGYMGTSQTLKPLEFVIVRCPNMLSGTADTYYYINGDANPVDCIFELLTNRDWTIGLPSNIFDIPSFKAAQKTIFDEKLGFSAIWDTSKEVIDVVNELLRLIDGTLYTDLSTGLIKLNLAREIEDENNLLTLNNDNCIVTSYSQSSYYDTTNEVRVKYIDRTNNYKERTAIAQDLANFRLQSGVVATDISYIGISNLETAQKIAYRDLRVLTTPLAKVTIEASRVAGQLRPSQVFKLTWNGFEKKITNQRFRVTNIGYGTEEDNKIRIEAVEDIFALKNNIYTTNAAPEYENVVQMPETPAEFKVVEAPYVYSDDNQKIMVFSPPAVNTTGFELSTSTASAIAGFSVDKNSLPFTRIGQVVATIDASYLEVDPTIINVLGNNLGGLTSVTETDIKNGANIALIVSEQGEEFIAFETVTQNTGSVDISNVWRGLFDTTPITHSTDIKVYFTGYGFGLSDNYDDFSTVYSKIKYLGINTEGSYSDAVTTPLVKRSLKPYAPRYIKINGSPTNDSITPGDAIVLDWTDSNRTRQKDIPYKQYNEAFTKEAGVSYWIDIYNDRDLGDGSFLSRVRRVGPLYTNTYTYTNGRQISDNGGTLPTSVVFHIYSKREGLNSYTAQIREVEISAPAPVIAPFIPSADAYVANPDGNAVALNGAMVEPTSVDGSLLIYNAAFNKWLPAAPSSLPINGDVNGNLGAASVDKIKGVTLASASPAINDYLIFNGIEAEWQAGSSGGGGLGGVRTYSVSAVNTISYTSTNVWENIAGLSVAFTPMQFSDLMCTATITYKNTNANPDKSAFRFILDNSIVNAEIWKNNNDAANVIVNNELRTITLHTVFRNVSNVNHDVKLQWSDLGFNQDVQILDRRISVTVCPSSFDPSFVPTSVTGLRYWFKADALTGLTDGVKAPIFEDYSGLGNHFTQGFSANQGTYRTNRINGLPAVEFDYNFNQFYNGTSFMSGFTAGEMFIIIKANAPGEVAISPFSGGYMLASTDTLACHYPYIDGTIFDNWGSTSRYTVGNPTTPLAQFNLYNVSSTFAGWKACLNRSLLYSTAFNFPAFNSTPAIGATNASAFFSGEIAEIIIFNREITQDERDNIHGYINVKYGI